MDATMISGFVKVVQVSVDSIHIYVSKPIYYKNILYNYSYDVYFISKMLVLSRATKGYIAGVDILLWDPLTKKNPQHGYSRPHTAPRFPERVMDVTQNRYRYLLLLASCLVDPQSPCILFDNIMFDRFCRLDRKKIYTYSLRLKTMLF